MIRSNDLSLKPTTTQPSTISRRRKLSNVLLRFITGMVMLLLTIIVVLWGGWVLTIPLMLIATITMAELHTLRARHGSPNDWLSGVLITATLMTSAQMGQLALAAIVVLVYLLAFALGSRLRGASPSATLARLLFLIVSILYIALPFVGLLLLRQIQPFGAHWVFAVLYNAWSNDTFAYFGGKFLGKHRLLPQISPNKTVEGALIGIACGAILSMIVLWRVDELTLAISIMLLIATIACVIGDFAASAIKRHYGAKDSHILGFNILPGHGGMLDRVDGLLWVLAVFSIFAVLMGMI